MQHLSTQPKESTQLCDHVLKLYGNLLLATRPTPKLEDLTTSAVRGSFMNHKFLQELALKSIRRLDRQTRCLRFDKTHLLLQFTVPVQSINKAGSLLFPEVSGLQR